MLWRLHDLPDIRQSVELPIKALLGMKGWPRVMQLTSTDKVSNNYMNFIVYFWAEPALFEENEAIFEDIMRTFNRRKLK